MCNRILGLILLLVALACPAHAQISVTYTFTNGTVIDADQMNTNFSALASNALNRTGGTLTGTININAQTLSGAATASGAWTFSSAGTALAVTNNATIGGTLGVTGVATFTTVPVFSAGLPTLAQHLLFTDATYDIGASGATRPRDLYLSRDAWVSRNVAASGTISAFIGTATPAGGAAVTGIFLGSANFGIYFGSGVPTVSAAKGSLYLRSDGSSTTTRAYVNTDGGTTWTALTTVG